MTKQRGNGSGALVPVSPTQIATGRANSFLPLWKESAGINLRASLMLAEVGREGVNALLRRSPHIFEFIGCPIKLEITNPCDSDGLVTPSTEIFAVVAKDTVAVSLALDVSLSATEQDTLVGMTPLQAQTLAKAFEADLPDLNTAGALVLHPTFSQHLVRQGLTHFIARSGTDLGIYSVKLNGLDIVGDLQQATDEKCGIVLVSHRMGQSPICD